MNCRDLEALIVTPLDDLPPEQHRQRYQALLADARTRVDAAPAPTVPLDAAAIVSTETIPPGWYHSLRLRRGDALRLVNTQATPGVSVVLWNAVDRSERLNVSDTMKVQWTARIRGGRVLLSDMGRILATIVADDCGWHDGLIGGSAPHGDRASVRTTRDNLLRAAAKHGLDARDLPPSFTFFAPVQSAPDGRLHWRDGLLRPGQAVDLVAEMDLLVAISNCPHALAPDGAMGAIEMVVWRPRPEARCLAQASGPEAARALLNTEAYLAE